MSRLLSLPPVSLLVAPAGLWISLTLRRYRKQLRPVVELGFERLGQCYSRDLLEHARFAPVDRMPVAPALRLWSSLEVSDGIMGLTLRNAYFVRREEVGREDLHAHELVHVIQWRLMGERAFLETWLGDEMERGYRGNRLERIAYHIQEQFKRADRRFDAEQRTAELLDQAGLLA